MRPASKYALARLRILELNVVSSNSLGHSLIFESAERLLDNSFVKFLLYHTCAILGDQEVLESENDSSLQTDIID